MYVIRFTKDSKVRYVTQTRGDTEYNAIDSAHIESAKMWKTQKGADNYLKSVVLAGRQGKRIQARWQSIEIVKIKTQCHPKSAEASRKLPPFISFCPTPEILQWLESERQSDESDTELLNRKLKDLINSQKYLDRFA